MSVVLAQAAPAEQVVGSTAEFWVFCVAAVLALGTALSVVIMRNAVHAALMLVINFFAIAVLYAALEAQFLAVVQIVVYAGAIMVLFLFVLMLLGITSETRFSTRVKGQRTAAVLLGVLLLFVLVGAGAGPYLGANAICPTEGLGDLCTGLVNRNANGNVAGVGRLLFTTYMWPFEATSALLVIAALGAMVLGKRHSSDEDVTDRRPDLEDVDDEDLELEGADEDAPRPELVAAGPADDTAATTSTPDEGAGR